MVVHFTPEQEAELARIATQAGTDAENLVRAAAVRMLLEEENPLNAGRGEFAEAGASGQRPDEREQPPVTRRDRGREIEWLRRNRAQYSGKWVALEGDRLIAAGEDANSVFRAAKQSGTGVPFVVHVQAETGLPFMGGW